MKEFTFKESGTLTPAFASICCDATNLYALGQDGRVYAFLPAGAHKDNAPAWILLPRTVLIPEEK